MPTPHTTIPKWCPDCGETNPDRYPYTLPGSVVGCRTCKSVWNRIDLEAKTAQPDPRTVERS